ncbi:hypothetical protein ACQEVZ_39605 [Dactylosporangium sp. CA-152071]|uniref:hypothetical protein n=1 Tax=Dactylosporangium sp. CA-152071 TaxID=3239933 RepID=UPI003D90A832
MPSRVSGRSAGWFVGAVALLLGAATVWQSSYAVFVAKADNPGNAWATGNLQLATQDGSGGPLTGTAVFAATDLRPGPTIAPRCVTVDYSGSIAPAGAIRLYAKDGTSSPAVNAHTLSSYLSLTIEEGTGATDVACTDFTASSTLFDTVNRSGPTDATVIAGSLLDFTTSNSSYATARVGGWTPAAAPPKTSRSYRFTVAFPGSAVFPGGGSDTIDSDLMSMTARTTFVWEVQS